MPESDTRPKKAAKHSHVTLTTGVDVEGAPEGVLVVGHRVRDEVADRSALLSGLAQSDGLAALPDTLSPQEIQLWQAAKLLGAVPSTDELVTILKVADVLCDDDQGAWMDLLAHRVSDTKWKESAQADAMLCRLLTLPPHLLQRCMTACVPRYSDMRDLLKQLPLPLHQPVIAACAASGSLTVQAPSDHSLLVLLSTTEVPPPGLRELELKDPDSLALEEYSLPAPHAAVLARTLAAHSSLTKVDLCSVNIRADALQQLAASLPRGALPCLADFTVKTSEHPDGCAAVIDCLKQLPTLTDLHFLFVPRRRQNRDKPALASLLRPAASPACLPSLEYLRLFEQKTQEQKQHRERPLPREPADNSVTPASCIPEVLPLIRAPALTHLALESHASHISFRRLRAAVAHLSSLRKLAMDVEFHDDPVCLSVGSAAAAVLPSLTDVLVISTCPLSPLLVTRFFTDAAPAMTSLAVVVESVRAQMAGRCTVELVTDAWAAMLRALGRCTRLQHLQLAALCGVHTGEGVLRHSADLAAALKPLSALTFLELSSVPELVSKNSHCRLHGEPLGEALAALKALQNLRLCSFTGKLEIEEPQHVLDACAGLPQLSRMGLCMQSEQEVRLPLLLPKLKALQRLYIGGSVHSQASGDVEALQTRFPDIEIALCSCKLAAQDE